MLVQRKRASARVTKDLEESLKNIYGQDKNLDMTKIERRHKSRLTSFLTRLVAGLFVLTIVSWGGFLWWQSGTAAPAQPLKISLETPENVISGSESCFKINYENIGRVPIAALSMSLNLPDTFNFKEAKPAATENQVWTMSPLGAGSDGLIEICGTFFSTVPGSEKIQAVFTYRPANFSSDFQDIAGATIVIDKSVVSVETTGSTEAVVGDAVTYTAKIKNTSDKKTENLRVRAILSETFVVTSTEPVLSETGSSYWDVPSLEAGAEQTITLTGSFASTASGVTPITFEVGFLNTEKYFIKQNESKIETNVIGGELSFHLIANGSDKDQTTNLGSRLRLSIDYTNQGQETMEGVSFILEINAGGKTLPFNLPSSDLGGGVKTNNTVTWDSGKITGLASLISGATGTIDSTLVISNSIDPTTVTDSFTLQLKAAIKKIGSTATTRTISSPPFTIKINSDTKFSAEARYYDEEGTPVGSGNLPPTVGQSTTYRIFWHLNNSLHDLKNSSTTMSLPANVTWTNNVQADNGSVTFNETTRQIKWSIDSLPKTSTSASAWFDVTITPVTSDVGKFFTLNNPATFEATDVITNDLIQNSTDALTTALPNDSLAVGKGVVE